MDITQKDLGLDKCGFMLTSTMLKIDPPGK